MSHELRTHLTQIGRSPRPEEEFRLSLEGLRDLLRRQRPGLCLLSNPHNPSGAIATRNEICALLSTARELAVILVVDEAFIDYAPEHSVSREVEGPGLIVIRSLTKFYGMPGMRIGFAVVSPDVEDSVRAQIPSWPAGRLDVAAALAAIELLDAEAARRENPQRRENLESCLRRAGLETYSSAANFLLARLADAMPPVNVLSDRLIREHRILAISPADIRRASRQSENRRAVTTFTRSRSHVQYRGGVGTKGVQALTVALPPLILALAVACKSAHEHSPGSTGRGVQYFEGVGQYLFHTTKGSQTTVTINHEEIHGFMDAMAMPYLIEDPSLVNGLEPGQDIEFRVVAEEGGFYFVDRITSMPQRAR